MRYLIIFLSLLLTACANVAPSYYSIINVDNVETIKSNDAKIKGVSLNLGPVPEQYDRTQLLIIDKSISPEVVVLNESLWVAPLQNQIQESLVKDVAHFLGVPYINGVSGLSGIRKINVGLVNFDMILNQGAYIQANWSNRLDDQKPTVCKGSVVVSSEGSGVASLVDSQKTAVRALAALIALQDQIKDTKIIKKIVSYDLGCTQP